jgi:hypothetical protein
VRSFIICVHHQILFGLSDQENEMNWHAACMEKYLMHKTSWQENLKETDHMGDLDVGGILIFSRVLVTADGVWFGE